MNINNNFYPIQVLPGIPSKNGIKFLGENEIEVIIDNANLIWNILSKCNGKTNVIDILKSLTNDSVNTLDIISDLAEIGIIVDSRKQFYLFHELIKSPSKYFYDLTTEEIKQIEESDPPIKKGQILKFKVNSNSHLMKLQDSRHSVRNYSDKKISIDQIGQVCDIGYNLKRHAVPSGGGLYPIKIFLIVLREQEGIKTGYYEYDSKKITILLNLKKLMKNSLNIPLALTIFLTTLVSNCSLLPTLIGRQKNIVIWVTN